MNKIKQFFCIHNFIFERSIYLPPPKFEKPANVHPTDSLSEHAKYLVHGETNRFYRCDKCGKLKIENYFGKDNNMENTEQVKSVIRDLQYR